MTTASADVADGAAEAPTGRSFVRRLLTVLVVDLVALAATGLLLAFRYRPRAFGESGTTAMEITARVHSIAAGCALLLLVLLAVAIAAGPRFARLSELVVGAGLAFLAAGVAIATGAQLAWQQLALSAVTTGANLPRGVVDLPDSVKYVLTDGHEMGLGEFRRRVAVHVLVLPVVLVVGLVVLLRSRRPEVPEVDEVDPPE